MHPTIRLATLLAALAPLTSTSQAATCSCAGTPLLGVMSTTAPDKGRWHLGSTYEVHEIDRLVSGSSSVHDGTGRERSSTSMLLEASYSFSENWSVSGLLSATEHRRKIGAGSTDRGRGLGDGIIMAKYNFTHLGLFERNSLAVGVGARVPIGEDDRRALVLLSEDMQPSTGAWSALLWAHGAHAFSQSAKGQVYATSTYSFNLENDRDYRFGDAFTLAVGGSYTTDSPWRFSGALRYRHADRDERGGAAIPNTGGEWLDFVPTVQYQLTDALAARVSGRVPIWRDVNDALQFTTSYAYSLSLVYGF